MTRYLAHAAPLRMALLAMALWIALPTATWAADSTGTKVAAKATVNILPAGLEMRYPEGDTAKIKSIQQESLYRLLLFVNTSNDTIWVRGLSTTDALNLGTGLHQSTNIVVNGRTIESQGNDSAKAKALFMFPPHLPVEVEVHSTLPTLGNWLIVLNGTQTDAKGTQVRGQLFQQMAITRVQGPPLPGKAKPSFMIEDIATLQASPGCARLRISIHDTMGVEKTINMPQVLLYLKGDNDAKFQAHYKAIQFLDDQEQPIDKIVVPANASQTLIVRIEGLCQAGAYTGTALFSAPGMLDLSRTFNINLRASCGWAILLIALGVGLGQGIVVLMNKLKPRLEMARKVAMLQEEIVQSKAQFLPLSNEESLIWGALENEAGRLANELGTSQPSDGDTRIKVLDAKIDIILLWTQWSREVAEQFKAKPPVPADILDILEDAKSYIGLPQANADGAAAIQTALSTLHDKIAAALQPAQGPVETMRGPESGESEQPKPSVIGQSKVQRKYKSLQNIESKLMLINIASTGLVVILSVLIGIKLFYLSNPIWGTASDMIVAFLWGFGLHTVAKNTDFTGGIFSFISGRFATSNLAAVPPPANPGAGGAGGGSQ